MHDDLARDETLPINGQQPPAVTVTPNLPPILAIIPFQDGTRAYVGITDDNLAIAMPDRLLTVPLAALVREFLAEAE